MKKSEVYSWRLDPSLKADLEEAARAESTSVARLLERIVRDWLRRRFSPGDEEREQRVRERAMEYIGSVHGSDPTRAQESAKRVKAILRDKRAPERTD